MAVPKYSKMYRSFLKALQDKEEHAYIDVKNQVISDFNLTEGDIAELLPSGKQSVFSNRIGWCRTYLKKAGLIDSPSRAHFIITDEGKRILDTVDEITDDTLRQFPSFVEFAGSGSEAKDAITKDEDDKDETPQETLERVHSELNKVLRDELLTKIHDNSPEFFERLIIELMEKMGYGTGKVTQLSRDEGIDGIVYQDKLGFDVIYIQAKRYDLEKKVGRPALQQFNGAVPDDGKGMFVTTGGFSAEAIKYANDKHIILIDGQRLAQLMIDYEFGVSTEYIYKVKKIDTDLFEED